MARSQTEVVRSLRNNTRIYTCKVRARTGSGDYLVACSFGMVSAYGGGNYIAGEDVTITKTATGEYAIISGASPASASGSTNIIQSPVFEGPGIDVAGDNIVGLGGDTLIIYDANGEPALEYPTTDDGLKAALLALRIGDVCMLPACNISGGPWVVQNGELRGISRFSSVLHGQLRMNGGARVSEIGIDAMGTGITLLAGETHVNDCYITVAGASDEDIYGVYAVIYATGHVRRVSLELYASGAGIAYGAFSKGGTIYLEHSSFVSGTTFVPVGGAQ